jgi:hypothetical protein
VLEELCPPGANVVSSAMIVLMLRAAGAELVFYAENPTFALVPAMIESDHAGFCACLEAGVPCLGAAFVPDLISRAQVDMAEYLADSRQRDIVLATITTASYESLSEGEAVALVKKIVTAEMRQVAKAGTGMESAGEIAGRAPHSMRTRGRRRLDEVPEVFGRTDPSVGTSAPVMPLTSERSPKRRKSQPFPAKVACKTPLRRSNRPLAECSTRTARGAPVLKASPVANETVSPCVAIQGAQNATSEPSRSPEHEPIRLSHLKENASPRGADCSRRQAAPFLFVSFAGKRNRRRAPIIAESPPSDDDSDMEVDSALEGPLRPGKEALECDLADVNSEGNISSSAEDDALQKPAFSHFVRGRRQPRPALSLAGSHSRLEREPGGYGIDNSETRHASPNAGKSPAPADVRCDVNRHRVRMRTPASVAGRTSSEARTNETGSNETLDNDGVVSLMQNLDEAFNVDCSAECVDEDDAVDSFELPDARLSPILRDYKANRLGAESALSLPVGKTSYCLPEMNMETAYAFVLKKVGGVPSSSDVKLLRKKYRVAAAAAARVERDDMEQLSPVDYDTGRPEENGVAEVVSGEVPDADLVPPRAGALTRSRLPVNGAGREAGLRYEGFSTDFSFPIVSSIRYLPRLVPSARDGFEGAGNRCNGNTVDDAGCEDEVLDLYWMFVADRIYGVSGFCSRVPGSASSIVLARQACNLLLESAILPKLFTSGTTFDMSDRFLLSLSGYCTRLLRLGPPEDVVGVLVCELMKVREQQCGEVGIDSLHVLVTSPQLPPVNRRHHVVSVFWVELLQLCDSSTQTSSFWEVFDKVANSLRQSNFAKNGLRMTASANAACVDSARQGICAPSSRVLTDWEEWSFRAARAFGSLYCIRLCDGAPTGSNASLNASDLWLVPNWRFVASLLVELVSSPPEGDANGGSDDRAVERLLEILRRIVLDLSCGMWDISEGTLMTALDSVHDFYNTRSVACSCTKVPEFLTQLRHRNDLRSRRSFLATQANSPCDYLIVMAWLFVADSSRQSSGKVAGRIVRLCTSLLSKQRQNGFRHALSLMLAVADAIVPPGSKAETGEVMFRQLMFSKAPSLSKAMTSSSAVGLEERSSWSAVLDAAVFRSRILAGSRRNFSCYVEFVATSFSQVVRCLERSQDVTNDDMGTREATRIQHRLLLDLSVEMIDTVGKLMVVASAPESNDNDVEPMLHSLDALLSAAGEVVNICGTLLPGILSQLRPSASRVASGIPRHGILVSAVRMFDSVLGLATTACRQAKRERLSGPLETNFPGMHRLLRFLENGTLTLLVDIVRAGVVLGNDQLEQDICQLAATTLARIIGLRTQFASVGPSIGSDWTSVMAVQRCGMDLWSSAVVITRERQRAPKRSPGPSVSASGSATTAVTATTFPRASSANDPGCEMSSSSSCSHFLSPAGRAMVAKFWTCVTDSLWVDAVFENEPSLERMVVAAWIVLLAAPEVVAHPQPVLSLAWSLKAACAARPMIASFFRNTMLHSRMDESDPQLAFIIVKLRPETVTDALAVSSCGGFFPLQSLRALVDVLTSVVVQGGLDSSNPAWLSLSEARHAGLRPFQCLQYHMAFAAELSALLFAIRSSMGKRLAAFSGDQLREVADESRRSLEAVSNVLLRLSNFAGTDASADADFDLQPMYCRVVALVLHGMSCMGYDSRAVDLRVRFTRFATLMGSSCFSSLVIPLAHQPVPQWLLELGLQTGADENDARVTKALLQRRRRAGEEWRKLILHSLVQDPLTCTRFAAPAYRLAIDRLLAVLDVHERVKSSATEVGKDIRDALTRMLSSLPVSADYGDHGAGLHSVSTTVDICQQVGFKVEALFSGRRVEEEDQAHARGLLALGTGIVGQATAILMGDAML